MPGAASGATARVELSRGALVNRDDALLCLERMAVIWPGVELPDPTLERWLRVLARGSENRAHETIESLAQSCKWWPSFAEWDAAVRITQVRARTPELTPGSWELTEEQKRIGRAGIAKARAAFASSRSSQGEQ